MLPPAMPGKLPSSYLQALAVSPNQFRSACSSLSKCDSLSLQRTTRLLSKWKKVSRRSKFLSLFLFNATSGNSYMIILLRANKKSRDRLLRVRVICLGSILSLFTWVDTQHVELVKNTLAGSIDMDHIFLVKFINNKLHKKVSNNCGRGRNKLLTWKYFKNKIEMVRLLCNYGHHRN